MTWASARWWLSAALCTALMTLAAPLRAQDAHSPDAAAPDGTTANVSAEAGDDGAPDAPSIEEDAPRPDVPNAADASPSDTAPEPSPAPAVVPPPPPPLGTMPDPDAAPRSSEPTPTPPPPSVAPAVPADASATTPVTPRPAHPQQAGPLSKLSPAQRVAALHDYNNEMIWYEPETGFRFSATEVWNYGLSQGRGRRPLSLEEFFTLTEADELHDELTVRKLKTFWIGAVPAYPLAGFGVAGWLVSFPAALISVALLGQSQSLEGAGVVFVLMGASVLSLIVSTVFVVGGLAWRPMAAELLVDVPVTDEQLRALTLRHNRELAEDLGLDMAYEQLPDGVGVGTMLEVDPISCTIQFVQLCL